MSDQTQNEQTQVFHEVYYGAHSEHIGWVEEGSMLSNLHRNIVEANNAGGARWIEVFSAGRGITALLAAPGIPVFTRAVVVNNPIE